MSTGNNLESKGSIWKNKKRALCLVTNTKVPLFKDHFWHFQIKITFRKKNYEAGQRPTTGH